MSRTFRLKKEWGYRGIYGPPTYRKDELLLRSLHKYYGDSSWSRSECPKRYRKSMHKMFKARSRQALYKAVMQPDDDILFPMLNKLVVGYH